MAIPPGDAESRIAKRLLLTWARRLVQGAPDTVLTAQTRGRTFDLPIDALSASGTDRAFIVPAPAQRAGHRKPF